MTKMQNPNLRLVDKALPADLLVESDADLLPEDREAALRRQPAARLARAKASFVRLSLPRAIDGRLYPPRARLLHVLIQASREGRREVELDAKVAKAAAIHLRNRAKIARRLERLGYLVIGERDGGALIVTVMKDDFGS
jgi:hypothetical protein